MKKISIVIPVYNEENIIDLCYDNIREKIFDILNYEFELIFVNDGSFDSSYEHLKKIANTDLRVKIINFSRNFGSQNAIMAGIKHVSGDAVIIMDADLQDPVEALPEMIKLWENGNDVIYGKRTKRKGESIFKKLSAKMFYYTLNALSDIEIPKDTGEFRLVDRKIIDVINDMPEHNKFLRGLFSWVGFNQVAFEYERNKRNAGKTKFSLSKMTKLAKDGIFSFSTKPIEIIGRIGFLSILLSFGLLFYSIISYIIKPQTLVKGWTSLIVIVTFFSGVQLISLWVMAQYIGRIYDETKNRPNYIIKETINIE